MIYISSFEFPDAESEFDFILNEKRGCYDSFYPFKVLSKNGFNRMDFEPITILYGGNGSGKSTALNVIAEKLKLHRDAIYNKSSFFSNYVDMCSFQLEEEIPLNSRIITSDDVFDYMLNLRNINQAIDGKREDLFKEYVDIKKSEFVFKSMDDYDHLKKLNEARSNTQSTFVKKNLLNNIRGYSNGESGYKYFTDKIDENELYILDEPENSLSPERQIELMKLVENSARYMGCQFIISTHSPFLLAMEGAKIYNLDQYPVGLSKWTELENIRLYFDFFTKHRKEF